MRAWWGPKRPTRASRRSAILGAHLPEGHLGQHFGVSFSTDQCFDHSPRSDTEDAAGDGIKLDPGVFQHFLEALRFADTVLDEFASIPREITKLVVQRWTIALPIERS